MTKFFFTKIRARTRTHETLKRALFFNLWAHSSCVFLIAYLHHLRANVYGSYARVHAWIFTKIILVIKYYLINFSVKFYKDPSFCLGEIQLLVKVEVNGLKLEKYPKINPPEMHLFWWVDDLPKFWGLTITWLSYT